MKPMPTKNHCYQALGMATLVLGWIFYLTVRGNDPLGLLDLKRPYFTDPTLRANLGSLPTLIHCLGLWLLLGAPTGVRTNMGWLLCVAGYEASQGLGLIAGTFDPFDATTIALFAVSGPFNPLIKSNLMAERNLLHFITLIFGAFTALATSGHGPLGPTLQLDCMDRAELSASYQALPPRPILRAGKIYRYQNLLLVSEPYKGIHLFNNEDPTNPVSLAFLNIPGNTDMAVNADHLYANSATDLLTVAISQDDLPLLSRQEGVLTGITAFLDNGRVRTGCPKGQVAVAISQYQDGDAFEKRIEENRK